MTSRNAAAPVAQMALATSIVVAAYFVATDAFEYLSSVTPTVYGRFWSVRDQLYVHVMAGGIALIVGAIQLCLVFLRRTSLVHRWNGRVYAMAVLVSSAAALSIFRKGSVFGLTWVALLVTLALCALVFTAFGVIEARRRHWQRHSAWMLRSYMAMMVFAWFRLAWELPVLHALPGGSRAAALLAATMLITFTVTELILARTSRRLRGN